MLHHFIEYIYDTYNHRSTIGFDPTRLEPTPETAGAVIGLGETHAYDFENDPHEVRLGPLPPF